MKIDSHLISSQVPQSQSEFILRLESCVQDDEFIACLASLSSWSDLDNEHTDLRAWAKILDRIDGIFVRYLKYNEARLVLVPFALMDDAHENLLIQDLRKLKQEAIRKEEPFSLKTFSPVEQAKARENVKVILEFLILLINNARCRYIFNLTEHIRELLAAKDELLEELALEVLTVLVKIPESHRHVEERYEEVETSAQTDIGLSKLLLCFAQGYGSKSQGVSLLSAVTEPSSSLPKFPGHVEYHYYKSPTEPISESRKELYNIISPTKVVDKKSELGLIKIMLASEIHNKFEQDELYEKLLKRYDLALKNRFAFLQRIRIARSYLSLDGRRRRTKMRLDSLAILFKICGGADLMPAYITHEPELTAEIVELITNTSFEKLHKKAVVAVPFDIKVSALRVLQRLPGSGPLGNAGINGALSHVGRSSNVLQHLGIMKGQASGVLTDLLNRIFNSIDEYFPVECPIKLLAMEESKTENPYFTNPEDELCFAFGMSFAVAATNYNEKAVEYSTNVMKRRDELAEKRYHLEENTEDDNLLSFVENVLLLSGEVTASQQGATLLATSGIMNALTSLFLKDVAERRRLNSEDIVNSVRLNWKRSMLFSQFSYNLSSVISISSIALSLAKDLDISVVVLALVEEIVLRFVIQNCSVTPMRVTRSRKSKTKKARSRRRDSLDTERSQGISQLLLLKEKSRLLPYVDRVLIDDGNTLELYEQTLLRNLLQFLVIFIQRNNDQARAEFSMKEADTKLILLLKFLFRHHKAFGVGNFNMACALFTEVLNLQPSSVYCVYRCDLHKLICDLILEDAYPEDAQSISLLPNVLNALCLHTDGEYYMKKSKVQQKFMGLIFKPVLLLNCAQVKQNLETSEYEEVYEICASNLDHLLRHHKCFKDTAIQSFLNFFESMSKSDKKFNKSATSSLTDSLAESTTSHSYPLEDAEKKTILLTSALRIFNVLTKNKDVVDRLYKISGAIAQLSSLYLLMLPKSMKYITRDGTENYDYIGAKVLTDVFSTLMFHELFTAETVSRLYKTVMKILALEEKEKIKHNFKLFSLIPEDLKVHQLKKIFDSSNSTSKKNKVEAKNRKMWKKVALAVKSLAYVEWLAHLLQNWMKKITLTQGFKKKLKIYYEVLTKDIGEARYCNLFLQVTNILIKLRKDQTLYVAKLERLKHTYEPKESKLDKHVPFLDRTVRFMLLSEVNRFCTSMESFIANTNNLYVLSNSRGSFRTTPNLESYAKFVDLSLLKVIDVLLDETDMAKTLPEILVKVNGIFLVSRFLQYPTAKVGNTVLAFVLMKKGILQNIITVAKNLLLLSLDIYSKEWKNLSNQDNEAKDFYDIFVKITGNLACFFFSLCHIADCSTKTDFAQNQFGAKHISDMWENRDIFKDNLEKEIEYYPYSHNILALRLKLMLLEPVMEILSHEQMAIMTVVDDKSNTEPVIFVFFGVIRSLLSPNYIKNSWRLFPEEPYFKLNVQNYSTENYTNFEADASKITAKSAAKKKKITASPTSLSSNSTSTKSDRDVQQLQIINKRKQLFLKLHDNLLSQSEKGLQFLLEVYKAYNTKPDSEIIFGLNKIDSLFGFAQNVILSLEDLDKVEAAKSLLETLYVDQKINIVCSILLAVLNKNGDVVANNKLKFEEVFKLFLDSLSEIYQAFNDQEEVNFELSITFIPIILNIIGVLNYSDFNLQATPLKSLITTSFNFLKLLVRKQSKKDYFDENEILGILLLIEKLLCFPKAREAFHKNNILSLIFQLKGDVRETNVVNVLSHIFMRIGLDRVSKPQQKVMMSQLLSHDHIFRPKRPLGETGFNGKSIVAMKPRLLFLAGLNEELVFETVDDLFDIRSKLTSSPKSMILNLKPDWRKKTLKIDKKDKTRDTFLQNLLKEIMKVFKKDFEPFLKAKKKKKVKSRKIIKARSLLKIIANIMATHPCVADDIFEEINLESSTVDYSNDVVNRLVKATFDDGVGKDLSLLGYVIRTLFPIMNVMKREALSQGESEDSTKLLDVVELITDISLLVPYLTIQTTTSALSDVLLEIMKLLAYLLPASNKQEDPITMENRMWTTHALLEKLHQIVTTCGLRDKKNDYKVCLETLYDKQIVHLLANSFNLFIPQHSKLFQCIGNMLTLLESFTQPETLIKWANIIDKDKKKKRVIEPRFLDSILEGEDDSNFDEDFNPDGEAEMEVGMDEEEDDDDDEEDDDEITDDESSEEMLDADELGFDEFSMSEISDEDDEDEDEDEDDEEIAEVDHVDVYADDNETAVSEHTHTQIEDDGQTEETVAQEMLNGNALEQIITESARSHIDTGDSGNTDDVEENDMQVEDLRRRAFEVSMPDVRRRRGRRFAFVENPLRINTLNSAFGPHFEDLRSMLSHLLDHGGRRNIVSTNLSNNLNVHLGANGNISFNLFRREEDQQRHFLQLIAEPISNMTNSSNFTSALNLPGATPVMWSGKQARRAEKKIEPHKKHFMDGSSRLHPLVVIDPKIEDNYRWNVLYKLLQKYISAKRINLKTFSNKLTANPKQKQTESGTDNAVESRAVATTPEADPAISTDRLSSNETPMETENDGIIPEQQGANERTIISNIERIVEEASNIVAESENSDEPQTQNNTMAVEADEQNQQPVAPPPVSAPTTQTAEEIQTLIGSIVDPQLRRDVLLSLPPEQLATLPEDIRQEAQLARRNTMPTTFIPAIQAPMFTLNEPITNTTRSSTASSANSSRERKRKQGLRLGAELTGFEDLVGEREIERLMRLFFHLRQGKKAAHKNVLYNLCETALFREIILCKFLQLIQPSGNVMSLCVRKVIDREKKTFTFEVCDKSALTASEIMKLDKEKKWHPTKMIGTSETIFTMYASQLIPMPGFVPFLAFRRVLEALRYICSRSKRVCILLVEKKGCIEFLFELLSLQQYFSNVKFISIMVEIIVNVIAPLNYATKTGADENSSKVSEAKAKNVYFPKERIIEGKYISSVLDLFGLSNCSEEIFVKLKAPLKILANFKDNSDTILKLSIAQATSVGRQAILDLSRNKTRNSFKSTSSELLFYRLLRVIKAVLSRRSKEHKGHLKLLSVDLKLFLEGFIFSIKKTTRDSSFAFPVKRTLSLSELGLGDNTPRAKRMAGRGPGSAPSSILLNEPSQTASLMNLTKKPKKSQVHNVALAVAQTKLTMIKCFLLICSILGEEADSVLIEFVFRFKNVLNSLIQQNSFLLENEFKMILYHPKCKGAIDFHNKRTYFKTQVKKLKANKRMIRLSVDRNDVYGSSFRNLAFKEKNEMLGKFSVTFLNEEGVDAGGVTREYYELLCRDMFNPSYCLFASSADSTALQPDSRSIYAEDYLKNFKFIGRMVAKAILEGILIDAHFTRSFYKHILSLEIDYRDIDSIDPQYYKSLCDLLTLNIEDLGLDLNFTTDEKEFGTIKTVELKPNGRNIKVTDENKMEYIRLCTLHKMTTGIKDQIQAFLQGFYEIVPQHVISIFNEQELELLICGVPEVDLEDLQNNTDYNGYTSESKQVKWFWKTLKSWPKEDHAKFLMFVTGTSKVPVGGFKNLVGMRGTQKFSIHKSFENDQLLPSAHTCFNQFDLPAYTCEKVLRKKLNYAIKEGGEGFGFR